MTAGPESGKAPLPLDEARQRLRDLGYLNGGVERFLFRRAFAGRGGLLFPAILLGAFAAAIASLAAVETAEAGFEDSVSAALALLLHLFCADLPVAGILALVLGFAADRSRAPAGAATAAGLAAAGLVFFLWIGGAWSLSREVPARALVWGAPVALAALLLARSVRTGFLARAYAHSRVLPAGRRRRVFLAAALTGILAAAAIFSARGKPATPPPVLPSPRGSGVVVVAVDGLALDAAPPESLSGVRELLATGATGWWRAKAAAPPPEVWTDLGTGEFPSRHGVRALTRVRPAGSPVGLRPPLGTAWYLRRLGPALRLVSSAPVSAADRRRLAFWEVAASAGLPAAAVGWWASAPWPGADVVSNEQVLGGASDGVSADRRAIEAARLRRRGGQQILTVYLPGLDILRGEPGSPRRAEAVDQVHRYLEEEVSRAVAGEATLVILAAESHPAPSALGRMVVFDGRLPVKTLAIRAEDAAPSILARAGVPVAADLPGHPVEALFPPGTLETSTVPTYGSRSAPAAPRSAATDREYLEKLKSLGYLN